MSATTSATTGRRYGLKRVCRTWERSRSALYARRARVQRAARGDGPARRGPTPALSDAQLLAAIRTDLARSPFQGEGHRKVHARLRILDDIRVSRTRVLRVMRTQGLLSPHRWRQGEMKAHEGTIVTSRPISCGAPTACGCSPRRTARSGPSRRWTTGTPSAWAGMCARWGAALRPSSRSRKGSGDSTARSRRTWPAGWRCGWITAASICRTTSSISFGTGASTPASPSLKSPKPTGSSSAGIARSRSKPSTAGSFRNLADVRAAVAEFVERYNQCWRLEKLAYRTPLEAREEYERRHARVAQTCVQETGCDTRRLQGTSCGYSTPECSDHE